MTLTAGVIIDDWKLAVFKRRLDAAGYSYTEHPGLTAGTLLLKVETASVAALQTTIEAAQKECRN